MEVMDIPSIKENDRLHKLIESKNYELKLNLDIYSISMELLSDKIICFKAKKKNNPTMSNYSKDYKYEELIKKLILPKDYYDSIDKIFKFYDLSLQKKKVFLKEDKNKKLLKLSLKKVLDYDEIECNLELYEKQVNKEEIIENIYSSISDIKTNNDDITNKISSIFELIKAIKDENDEIKKNMKLILEENKNFKNSINLLKNENEEIKNNIKLLNKENRNNFEKIDIKLNVLVNDNKIFKNNFENYKEYLNKKIIEEKENKKNLEKINSLPELHFQEYLIDDIKYPYYEFFIGLIDNIEYLIFTKWENHKYPLFVMKIKENKIIKKILDDVDWDRGGKIKYYNTKNKEEFILSNSRKAIIVFDIHDNYEKKYCIEISNATNIIEALFINDKNYIILKSQKYGDKEGQIGLYELKKKNYCLIDYLYETESNEELPVENINLWTYNNKHYCILYPFKNNKIPIINIFEEEYYGTLFIQGFEPKTGYIYNDYLYTIDKYNYYLRIWDLINKIQYKQIYFGTKGYDIISWDKNYALILSNEFFNFIDLEKGEIAKKIETYNNERYIKKIYLNDLGECLLCLDVVSSRKGNIGLYH